MAFKRAADGVASKGKTNCKNYGEDGKKVGITKGGKRSLGVTGEAMRKVGRNMARVNYQK